MLRTPVGSHPRGSFAYAVTFALVKEEWRDDAACKGVDPAVFFPMGHHNDREAKRICKGCEVCAQCGWTAVFTPWLKGIWGGMNESDREAVRRGWRPSQDLVPRPRSVPS